MGYNRVKATIKKIILLTVLMLVFGWNIALAQDTIDYKTLKYSAE